MTFENVFSCVTTLPECKLNVLGVSLNLLEPQFKPKQCYFNTISSNVAFCRSYFKIVHPYNSELSDGIDLNFSVTLSRGIFVFRKKYHSHPAVRDLSEKTRNRKENVGISCYPCAKVTRSLFQSIVGNCGIFF